MRERLLVISVLAFLVAGCDEDGDHHHQNDAGVTDAGDTTPTDAGDQDGGVEEDLLTQEAIDTYASIVLASYDDTITATTELQAAITAFTSEPSEANLQAAKDAWVAAREPYGQTEVYRFYDGPIDHPENGPEGSINAWPMDESFVDYVEGMPATGFINDTSVTIDAETLEGLNGDGGADENVATGWHPIEFMLWGQDLSDTGPGARPYTDFVDGGTADNQERRRTYLTTLAEVLLTHLRQVRDEWTESGTYRAAFVADDSKESLRKILAGMVILSGFETGGERLQTALDTGDQEDEHSCFSDNTHRDMYLNALGVQNVYLGRYTRLDGSAVEGTSIYDVVAAQDQAIADTLRDQIQASVTAAEALNTQAESGETFDRLIAPGNAEGNAVVQALIDALRAQEETMVGQVFPLLGVSVEIPTE